MEKSEKIQTKSVEWSDIPTRIVGGGSVGNRIKLEDYLLYLFDDRGLINIVDKENGVVKQYKVNPLKKKLCELAEKFGELGVHQVFFVVNNRFSTPLSLDIVYQTVVKNGGFKFRYSVGLSEDGEIITKETQYELEHSDPNVNKMLKDIVESTILSKIDKLLEYISNIAREYQLKITLGMTSMEIFWFQTCDEPSIPYQYDGLLPREEVDGFVTIEEAKKLSQLPNTKIVEYVHTIF